MNLVVSIRPIDIDSVVAEPAADRVVAEPFDGNQIVAGSAVDGRIQRINFNGIVTVAAVNRHIPIVYPFSVRDNDLVIARADIDKAFGCADINGIIARTALNRRDFQNVSFAIIKSNDVIAVARID